MGKDEILQAAMRLDKKMSKDYKKNGQVNEEDWQKYLKLTQEYYGK